MKRIFLCTALPLLLAACASSGGKTGALNEQGVTDAALTPLGDLNLIQAKIPAVLQAAALAPYAVPEDKSCLALAAAVEALDTVLGPDMDATEVERNLYERSSEAAGNAAVGALRGAAEGVVPFRGWVRKLTGAERNSNLVAKSISAGTTRRAYLKGLGQAAGCMPPAAPKPVTPAK